MLSAGEYEALKDMRVKNVNTGAETPIVKATGGWVRARVLVWCVRVGVRVRVIVCVVCLGAISVVYVVYAREEIERVSERQNEESDRLSERQRRE